MIFYQLIRHCAQKHPYPPPENISKQVCWRYIAATFVRLYTILIFILFLVGLSAKTCKAQNITITNTNGNLRSIMTKIERQTGYDFWYNKGAINESEKITIDIKEKPLEAVLKIIFSPRQVSFQVIDKTIFLKPLKVIVKDQPVHLETNINGTITDEKKQLIPGATIRVKNTNKVAVADEMGKFTISDAGEDGILMISSLGFKNEEVAFSSDKRFLEIILESEENNLKEVEVVSTGYQSIPKERATGSFAIADSALLNKRVGTNILDRLDGAMSGVVFNRNLNSQSNNSEITVRGRSTIFANAEPLIVLDNFPYDGRIENINPNDIDNISILKDAAAASIWGVRAGNGVIVITTKKGKSGKRPIIAITSNFSISEKSDIYNLPRIGSADYIALEEYLFARGFYNTAINNRYSPITPAVEVFLARRNGTISIADSSNAIGRLKTIDGRDQYERYFLQNPTARQHQLSISGGDEQNRYYISAGLDQNKGSLITDSYQRLTLSANNTYFFLNKKLEIFTGLGYTSSNTKGSSNAYVAYSPYDQLSDTEGRSLPVYKFLKKSYIDTVGRGKLLDWNYRPLDEMEPNRTAKVDDYRINVRASYKLTPDLKLSLNYQYQLGASEMMINNEPSSYFVRNAINTYSTLNQVTGVYSSPIIQGNIINTVNATYSSQNFRPQIEFSKSIRDFSINFNGGAEVKDFNTSLDNQNLYGYDPGLNTNGNALISPVANYTNLYTGFSEKIQTSPIQSGATDRYASYFLLGSVAFKNLYTLSGSYRRDESNLFGVKTNQKGIPLWSIGGKYAISSADFYQLHWLPQLSVRGTYGYNGNVDKTTSAYLTSGINTRNRWDYLYSSIINPPNPALSWERVKNINIGLDFGSNNGILTGSIDFYLKKAENLIANGPIAPQTGLSTFKGNSANTRNRGMDLSLQVKWMTGKLAWNTGGTMSLNNEIITAYKFNQVSNLDLVFRNYNNPLEGYPYYAVFSYKSPGLDIKGNPIGYFNGLTSTSYAQMQSSYNRDDLVYHGSAVPTVYGNLRNDIRWKSLSLSINLVYKLGYYFKRTSVYSGSSFTFQQTGYTDRWQLPGDEFNTIIPATVYPANASRASFFTNSELLVLSGDHIRIQDLQLNYSFEGLFGEKQRNSGSVYLFVNNIGILWRANKFGLDPEYGYQRAIKTISLGFKLNLN